MDDARLLDACLMLCDRLGIEVRFSRLMGIADDETVRIAPEGGLCRVRDKWMIILPREWALADRAQALARAVAQFDFEDMYLPPALRETLTALSPGRDPGPASHHA